MFGSLNPCRLILGWWRARQRRIDIEILWPSCKKAAGYDIELARSAFQVHALLDEAWTCLDIGEWLDLIEGLK